MTLSPSPTGRVSVTGGGEGLGDDSPPEQDARASATTSAASGIRNHFFRFGNRLTVDVIPGWQRCGMCLWRCGIMWGWVGLGWKESSPPRNEPGGLLGIGGVAVRRPPSWYNDAGVAGIARECGAGQNRHSDEFRQMRKKPASAILLLRSRRRCWHTQHALALPSPRAVSSRATR